MNNNSTEDSCDNNEDEDEDNISVTGTPELTNLSTDVDEERKSPMIGGAFTSLIHKNHSLWNGGANGKKHNADMMPTQHPPAQHAFNHALAAQLFLQNPLIPQPSQWLYSQLYGNYQEQLPWLRHSLMSNGNGNTFNTNHRNSLSPSLENNPDIPPGINLIKRSITLITNNNNNNSLKLEEHEDQDTPVSSSKRTPSPTEGLLNEKSMKLRKRLNSINGSERSRTPKQIDVWRPY